MRNYVVVATVLAGLSIFAAGAAKADPATDRAFVAKVSQGGMFEVKASRLATTRGAAADVRDFAAAEVHDHELVGVKLKRLAAGHAITFGAQLNTEFERRLDRLKRAGAAGFDAAYMADMADIHDKDGAAFAKESADGDAQDLRAFAAETHTIVLRHIAAIHAAPPPAK